jgi:hypothetical protein
VKSFGGAFPLLDDPVRVLCESFPGRISKTRFRPVRALPGGRDMASGDQRRFGLWPDAHHRRVGPLTRKRPRRGGNPRAANFLDKHEDAIGKIANGRKDQGNVVPSL